MMHAHPGDPTEPATVTAARQLAEEAAQSWRTLRHPRPRRNYRGTLARTSAPLAKPPASGGDGQGATWRN